MTESDESPDDGDIANVALIEARILKVISELKMSMGMCQIQVTKVEEQGN
jgi:hypothetical protein